MSEEWRDIQGYDGFYQVSNLGRVRSCDRIVRCGYGKTRKIKGVLLKPNLMNTGYYSVMLSKECKGWKVLVHRLVCEAFIPNPYNKQEVDHIDGNRINNNVCNLHWVTGKENMNNPIALKRLSESHKGFVPSPESVEKRRLSNIGKIRSDEYKLRASLYNSCNKAVVQFSKEGLQLAVFRSAAEAERQTGVRHPDIAKVCKGKGKTAGGFIWRYQ